MSGYLYKTIREDTSLFVIEKMFQLACDCERHKVEYPPPERFSLRILTLALQLIWLEQALAKPIEILSGYRCPSHPLQKINPQSLHGKGLAVDITYPGIRERDHDLILSITFFREVRWHPEEKYWHLAFSKASYAQWLKYRRKRLKELAHQGNGKEKDSNRPN